MTMTPTPAADRFDGRTADIIQTRLRRRPDIAASLRDLGLAVEYFPNYVNRHLKLHSPGIVLLSVIIRGRGWHILGDETHEEIGGSVGITHYGQFHDILTSDDGMDVMNVYLDLERHALPRLPRDLAAVLPEILPLHPCFQNRLNRRVRLQFADGEALARPLFAIERELRDQPPGYREAALAHFTLFLMDCCRQALAHGFVPGTDATAGHAVDGRLERLRRGLDRNFAASHSLDDLAREAGMSTSYLCRAFKRYTGHTVVHYLMHRRVQNAMLRLRTSDDKVAAIAIACGFADLSHFNRTFRQVVGVPPMAYRTHRLPEIARHDS